MRAVSLPRFQPGLLFTRAVALAAVGLVVLAICYALGVSVVGASEAAAPLDLPFRW
jgi:hypothetical protein